MTNPGAIASQEPPTARTERAMNDHRTALRRTVTSRSR